MKPSTLLSTTAILCGLLSAALPVQAAVHDTVSKSVKIFSVTGEDSFVLAESGSGKDGSDDDHDDDRDDDRDDDNSGHGSDDDDDDDDHGGHRSGDDSDDDDSDDDESGSGRDRPRIPGGSGCDDPGDVQEHPECSA